MSPLDRVVFLVVLVAAGIALAQVDHIKVPEGFVVERVASPPIVTYPMMAGFDDRGRLFVAENAGVNLKFDELIKDPPSWVVMLEDVNRDGVFDKRTVFADKLAFPSGALWHEGALYVASPPGIWRFRDTNDDGVADERTQIVTGFNSSGNAADLHGPFLGPGGWLYFTDGRNGHDLTLGDGTRWKGKAACLYRCRPDGSGLEVVFGGGFDNPVEVAFTPEGEPLVNVNIVHAHPQRVDAILYGIEGGNYPHDAAWRELPRTGDFLPPAGDLGWVATSGFMRYRGDTLGPKYAGRYFSTEFNTRRIRSHVVERAGAGFNIAHDEFLTSDNPDFHPTDVLEDADGSLLVIDTGAWFRIGCPASKVAKPEITGAIYRVRRRNASIANETIPEKADRRLAEIRLLGLNRDAKSEPVFLAGLGDADLAIRRESATGLGRLRSSIAVGPLLDAMGQTGGDKFLEHAITFALISIGDRAAIASGLKLDNPAARRAALVALDETTGENLTVDLVLPHLASENAPLRETALAIATAHPEWADQIVPTLRTTLGRSDASANDVNAIRAALIAFAKSPGVQALIADGLNAPATNSAARLALLDAITAAGVSPLPERWVASLRTSLADDNDLVMRHAIDAVRASATPALDEQLMAIAEDASRDTSVRIAALSVALPRLKLIVQSDFQLLVSELSAKRDPLARLAAANALATAPLDEKQLGHLAKLMPEVGPLELATLLGAFERSTSAAIGASLVESLSRAKSLAGLTPDRLGQTLAKYPPSVRDAAAPLVEKISPDAAAQEARLAELQPLLTGGDPARGQAVFFNKSTACASCHAVNGTGAHVGPDLSKIASIRSGRDLLESVVFPSNSFARGYESFVVQTKSNQVHAGVLAGESSDAIVLRTPTEIRVPRVSIKLIRQDRVSIMPQGLDAQLKKEELADLLAFLQSLK